MPQRAHFHASSVTSASTIAGGGSTESYVPINAMPIVFALW